MRLATWLRAHGGAAHTSELYAAGFGKHAIAEHVARCQERVDALAIWESAIRKGLADPAVLARVQWHSAQAEDLAALSSSLSDSGLETHFTHLMRGHGVRVRQQVLIDGRRVDGLIGECLIVQLDGFAHHRSAVDRRRDIEADARLRLRGYTVLRFDYVQILFHPDEVAEVVLLAMAQGLHHAARPSRHQKGRPRSGVPHQHRPDLRRSS